MALGTDPLAGKGVGTRAPQVSSAIPQDPRTQVSSYVNQQLGGLISGTSPTVGAADRGGIDGLSNPFGEDDHYSLSPVSRIHQAGQTRLKESQARINTYQQIAAQKRQKTATAGRQYDMGGGGVNWSPNASLSASRNRALQLASSYIGKTPYQFGGTSYKGIDCSGLVMAVYNQFGYNLNHSAGTQGRTIPGVRTSINNLQPGDIVAWKDGSHIAIYAGNGNIIEAAKPGTLVRTHKLWSNAVYGIHLQLPGE